MKSIVKAVLIIMVLAEAGFAQNVNWRSVGEGQRNVVQFNAGYDFGAIAQIGYGRSFTVIRPVWVGLDFSFPMGGNLTDDFKARLGGQIEVVQVGGFSSTIRIFSNFRRYQTQLVRIVSFGADCGILAGYYATTWYAGGEFGFDKAIATQLRHSEIMRADFPAIRDGWYLPTGGHYYYGIQGGKTIGQSLELCLRVGATNAQYDDENAVIPLYVQVGLGVRF